MLLSAHLFQHMVSAQVDTLFSISSNLQHLQLLMQSAPDHMAPRRLSAAACSVFNVCFR